MNMSDALVTGPLTANAVLDSLAFLARLFGRRVEHAQILGDTPVPAGAMSRAELASCAARAGLTLTPHNDAASAVTSTMLPALIVTSRGDTLVVIERKQNLYECVQPGIEGSRLFTQERLEREYPGNWYLARPILQLDSRSLLYHLPQPRRWFWDTFLANKSVYGWALLATVFINLIAAVVPFFTMAVYDRVVPNNALASLWVLSIAAVVVTLFDLVIKLLRNYLVEAAARRADVTMSSQIFAQALRLRAAARPASGGVLANIVRDFEAVREFFAATTLTLFGDLPFMLFFLAIIALIGGWLVLVPLIMIPLILLVAWSLQPRLTKLIASNQEESAQRTAHLFEVMNGLDIIKSMGANAWARRKWEMLTVHISETSLKLREWTSFGSQTALMLNGLSTVLLVAVGAMMVAKGQLTVGQLIAVTMLATRAVTPATQIAALILRYQQTKLSLQALDKVMDSPIDDSEDSVHVNALRGDIEFRDVHFAYPNSPPLLKGLNLHITPGERIGFVGRIGSGKSTLMRLLINLYAPQQGAVLVDGIAAHQIEPQSLRRHIGYVPQDVTLFHGSIRENILLGATDVNDAMLIDAIKRSCLNETLAQLPGGLGTQVGEGGGMLSGGQRQAVSIARALVRQPNVLLLDEPSSMMDPATEQTLIQHLRELHNVTLLLVTHRTAMLPLVDRLVVLDQGRVIMDGRRDDVLRQLQVAAAQPASNLVKAKL